MADGLCRFEIEEILGLRASSQDPENLSDEKPISNPVATFLEKLEIASLAKRAGVDFAWDAPVSIGDDAPLTKNHPHDGEEIERSGTQLWKYTYKGGVCTHMLLEDPKLEDGRMEFDGEGNEIAT